MEKTVSSVLKELLDIPYEEGPLERKIELAFEGLTLYCQFNKPNQKETIDCCIIAIRLSGYVQKGLGRRAKQFVFQNEQKLPERAIQVLLANVLRMECF